MKIFKVLIFILFLIIFSFNIAYSDEISYQDEWLKATYTNRKITKDISHWEFDRNFFITHELINLILLMKKYKILKRYVVVS